jgi:hypothetical protein
MQRCVRLRNYRAEWYTDNIDSKECDFQLHFVDTEQFTLSTCQLLPDSLVCLLYLYVLKISQGENFIGFEFLNGPFF